PQYLLRPTETLPGQGHLLDTVELHQQKLPTIDGGLCLEPGPPFFRVVHHDHLHPFTLQGATDVTVITSVDHTPMPDPLAVGVLPPRLAGLQGHLLEHPHHTGAVSRLHGVEPLTHSGRTGGLLHHLDACHGVPLSHVGEPTL